MRHGDIWAGCIDTVQSSHPCTLFDEGRDAMCCENHCSHRNLLQQAEPIWPIQRDHLKCDQLFDRMAIVDNLTENIDGTRHRGVFCRSPHNMQGIYDAVTIP